MGRTGDGLGSVLVVGLEYVGVLEQLSKWSNNLSGISLAVSPVSPPPLPPTYLTPDYAFPGLVLPQTFHTPQVRSAACAARSIQCGPLADDVKHGLHPANGLLSLDLGLVTQGGGKVSKCEGMISMAWEGNRERERARVLIRRDQTTKASSVVAVRCRSEALPPSPLSPSSRSFTRISHFSLRIRRSVRCTLTLAGIVFVFVTLAASPVTTGRARRSPSTHQGGQASRTVFPSSRDLAGTDIEKERPPASSVPFSEVVIAHRYS